MLRFIGRIKREEIRVLLGLAAFAFSFSLVFVNARLALAQETQVSAFWPSEDEAAAEAHWQELLINHSITDFCGLQDYHVRQGYQILRRDYANRLPLSFERLQGIRREAVQSAEAAVVGKGFDNFSWFCSTAGNKAAKFFVDEWAKGVEIASRNASYTSATKPSVDQVH